MSIILDEGVTDFFLLQVYHKLKLEVDHPNGPKWRFSPMKQAKQIMEMNNQPCAFRTKAKVLEVYTNFLKEKGVIKDG